MGYRTIFTLAIVILVSFGVAHWPAGAHGKKHNPLRYEWVMKKGIPADHAAAANPLTSNAGDLAKGAKLYGEHCASCHGPTGKGDGPDGKDLKPKPPGLRGMMTMITNMKKQHGKMKHKGGMMGMDREMSMMTEGYLYWTISEGGEALGTAMPGFKDVLSEKERWQVILFMSNGFDAKAAQ